MRQILYLVLLLTVGCSKEREESEDFEQLMGKATSHWKHVKQEEDLSSLERYKILYEKNKHFLSELFSHYKIPKTVHFIWLGPRPFPPQSVENVRTWIAMNPEWTFKFWTDSDRPAPCSGMEKKSVEDFPFQFLADCYAKSQNYGEKSDILRYEILYQEGGVYSDHDANCLKPFDPLHQAYDFYCGLETPHPPFVDLNITMGNGVVGSRPHHPVTKKVMELITERFDALGKKYRSQDRFSRAELVLQRTYIALTHALKGNVDQPGNRDIVLPAAYFFAKSGVPSLYSKHFYATAWAEGEKRSEFERATEKTLIKIRQKNKNIRSGVILTFLINLAGGTLLLFSFRRSYGSARNF